MVNFSIENDFELNNKVRAPQPYEHNYGGASEALA